MEDNRIKRTIRHRLVGWWLALSILLLLVVGYATLGVTFGIQPGWLGQFSALQPLGIVVLAVVSGIGGLIIIAAFWAERMTGGTKEGEKMPSRVSTLAEEMAAKIRMRAQKEAEAQAATIIAEAKRKAQEIATEAKRRAETATRREVNDILEEAKRQAETVEEGARQQAMAFLVQAREQLVDDLTTVNDIWVQEVKGVYYQLFSSLQDLVAEMERVESEWKSRSTELLRGRTPEPKGLEATPSLAIEAAELLTETRPPAQGEETPQISGEEVVEPPAQPSLRRRLFSLRKRPKLSKAPARGEETPQISGEEVVEPPAQPSLRRRLFSLRKRPKLSKAPVKGEEEPQTSGEEVVEPPVQPQGEVEAPISEEEAVPAEALAQDKEEPQISGEEVVEPPVQPQGEVEAPISEEEAVQPGPIGTAAEGLPPQKADEKPVDAQREPLSPELLDLHYVGEVELTLVPPVELTKVSELYERLKTIPEVKILRTVGSWDRGTTVTVALDKPLSLFHILSEMPGFEARPAQFTHLPRGERSAAAGRIEITAKKG